ncbi:DNA polymerase III subunit gamma/tau [Arenicella xantha]|uniref:DNA polymerase III subunit gamma/tau n=1 Tax=Arenicella xantha TaxID=644221 RepID=A0A395JKJ2_9GAMM|nr:DNA polymerase III subunit gamma/tau [Arenicella xantha]RBP49298.1 DNA polymerase III gamma subunit /DNA polymerase III tau subunit [Arenicella xantha]
MAYLALARKWRPKSFSEVVGQSHVVQALSNALDSGRVHHAFLFTGTRGVGKTTLARIFAKSLNCENGTSAEPCQACNTCISIDEGRYVDLIEVDAASRTKVDDTRELLENVQYAPTVGKYKVYLIDEVHMLSGHSFNALLKTLEEPPEHVKFLFATTDPQKLPVTVLSRCLQFNLRAMRPEQVENQLVKILGNEGMSFDQTALHAIAKAADGSMRDGLSLLDQAIAQGDGEVRLAEVESMLGTIKAEHTESILRALATQDVDTALNTVRDMADHAVDFSVALDDVLMQLYYVSLAQLAPSALSATDANQGIVTEIAALMSPELVQLYYQIGLIGKRDVALAPSLRVGFEMALLRMLAFDPVDEGSPQAISPAAPSANTSSPAPGSQTGSQAGSQKSGATSHASPPQTSTIQSQDSPRAVESEVPGPNMSRPVPITSIPEQAYAADVSSSAAAPETVRDTVRQTPLSDSLRASSVQTQRARDSAPKNNASSAEPSPAQPTVVAMPRATSAAPIASEQAPAAMAMPEAMPAANTEPESVDQPGNKPSQVAVALAGQNEWGELVEQTNLIGLPKELAMNCACERLTDERIQLSLAPRLSHLFKPERLEKIIAAVRSVVKAEVDIKLELEESDKETPAECLTRLGHEQFEQTKESIKSDPGVRALMSEFGATINEQSIKTR